MKVYLIQEDYTCTVENSIGECYDEAQSTVCAVCLSREALLDTLPEVICDNCEEYYTVDVNDYILLEAEVDSDGSVIYGRDDKFRIIGLTEEERRQVRHKAGMLINERIAKYGG